MGAVKVGLLLMYFVLYVSSQSESMGDCTVTSEREVEQV